MDIFNIIKELQSQKDEILKIVTTEKIEKSKNRIAEIEELSKNPNFWDNENSKNLLIEKSDLENDILESQEIKTEINDLLEFIEMSKGDFEGNDELLSDIEKTFLETDKKYKKFMTSKILSSEYDKNNAILSVQAGSGGTEAMDWADMLLRMYLRYSENNGYKTEIIDKNDDGTAGIKSVTILVKGKNAYGYLKNEKGVHRLVRISPFDSNKRRHTSFAAVDVSPEITNTNNVEIKDEDIRIDTFRSSGAGGQHVNKTDSAIRITHFPTGIVVSCQNQRSQHQNKDFAMRVLISKLTEIMEQEHKDSISELKGKYNEITWGSQIRSYVLQPYKMVKDHRTGFEMTNTDAVLDGDIDGFILENLLKGLNK